jgi:hypothetical protein
MPRSALRFIATLAGVAAVFVPHSARAQWVVADPTSQALEGKLLLANIEQSFTLGRQLAQLQQSVQVAQQGLTLARDVYAGIGMFQNFNAQQFLEAGQTYFLAGTAVGSAVNFYQDITTNGLNGGVFSPSVLQQSTNLYGDVQRRLLASQTQGSFYDARSALTLSREVQSVIHSSAYQDASVKTPEPGTPTEGLIAYDELMVDPQLLSLSVHQRAEAEQQGRTAMQMYLESLGASPGKAQQLVATSTTLAAVELARINDKAAASLNVQQLDRVERSTAAAQTRRENDMLWGLIVSGLNATYSSAAPAPEAPSLTDR